MTIISKINGGLGNQMFQYAMGKAVAKRNGVDLLLDTSSFSRHKFHNGFELESVFNISSKETTEYEIYNLLGWKASPFGRKILNMKYFAFLRGKNYYLENGLAFNENIFMLPGNSYLSGYWQSERYFNDCASLIRSEFIFKLPLSGINSKIESSIINGNSVSLHVRRGDYVTDTHTNLMHGTCTLDYYKRAVNYIESRLNKPKYFVFSDDIEWVKKNLLIDSEHYYIDHNSGGDSYNDMHLMSRCQHNIVANSSFSWWGAWLNPNKNKIVIAPTRWFNSATRASRDIVPESWGSL